MNPAIQRMQTALLLLMLSLLPQQAYTQTQSRAHNVTRAEAAMLLLKNRQPPINLNPDVSAYSDISRGQWYTPYMVEAGRRGMIQQDPVTRSLKPHEELTRAQFLRMLTIALNIPQYKPYGYVDVEAFHWYAPYAGVAATYKLFFSDQDPRRLHPNVPVTHRDAAEAFYAALKAEPDVRRFYAFEKPHTPESGPLRIEESQFEVVERVPGTYVLMTQEDIRSLLQDLLQRRQEPAEQTKSNLLAAVNETRRTRGAPPLTLNQHLSVAAEKHGMDMQKQKYFSHFSLDGRNYVDRIQAAGYTDVDPAGCGCNPSTGQRIRYTPDICQCRPRIALGENLAKGQRTVEEVMQDWMESPGHRANILYPDFSEIGLALVGDIWVQEFGRFKL